MIVYLPRSGFHQEVTRLFDSHHHRGSICLSALHQEVSVFDVLVYATRYRLAAIISADTFAIIVPKKDAEN